MSTLLNKISLHLTDLRNLMINATAALLINTRKNTYVQRMQKELEFRRRKDEEILSSYSEYQPRIESNTSLSLGYY